MQEWRETKATVEGIAAGLAVVVSLAVLGLIGQRTLGALTTWTSTHEEQLVVTALGCLYLFWLAAVSETNLTSSGYGRSIRFHVRQILGYLLLLHTILLAPLGGWLLVELSIGGWSDLAKSAVAGGVVGTVTALASMSYSGGPRTLLLARSFSTALVVVGVLELVLLGQRALGLWQLVVALAVTMIVYGGTSFLVHDKDGG